MAQDQKSSIWNTIANPIGQVAGAGLGLLLEGHEDKRQINQQQKLQDMQIAGQQQMGKYNEQLQEQLWNATSYQAQKKQLEAAGLNPALMYGQGGGGGVTANLAAGNVTAGQAPHGTGQEPIQTAGLGMQMATQTALIQSQIEVNKSIANKNNTDATNTAGPTTQLQQAQTTSVQATTENTQAQTALTKVNTAIANIQKGIQADISDKGYIQTKLASEVDLINQQAVQIQNSNWQFSETKESIIQNVKQQTINAVIQGAAMKAGITLTNEQVSNLQQQIEASKTNQSQMQAHIQQLLSSAGLMDKEKSLLLTQTIIQGIGTVANGLKNMSQIQAQ
jgi:hypothetical protein